MLSNTRDSVNIEIVDQQDNDPHNKEILKPVKQETEFGKPNNISKNNKREQFNEGETEVRRNSSSQSPSVAIVCDSMIKNLEKRLLQRSSQTRLEENSGN